MASEHQRRKTFINVTGATSTALSFTTSAGQSGNEYRAVFTNSLGTVTTAVATLTLLTAPVVTSNPVSQIVAAGHTVTFTAAASGNPTPTVQWQVSTDGGKTFVDIAGATSKTLTLSALAALNGRKYKAVFTNSQGSATSAVATLTVH